jgi:flagellar motor switch protein FliG
MQADMTTATPPQGGLRRAAILVLVLGTDAAREVFQRLSEREMRQLAIAAKELQGVTRDEVEAVLKAFVRSFRGTEIPSEGAGTVFEVLMERALGSERVQALLEPDAATKDPYQVCSNASPDLLAGLLRNEHPQTIAIVLASLPAHQAGAILELMGPELTSEVIYRLATLSDVPDDIRLDVGETLAAELTAMGSTKRGVQIDGTSIAVEITKSLSGEFSDEVLELLEDADEDFANGIRSKLFVFDDLAMLDARTMQRLLREVDSKQLMVALKGTPPDVQDSVFGAMSSRAAEMLREDMEASPPVRIKDVEDAQAAVIEVAFRLENEGAITLPRGGAGEMV